MKIDIDEVGCFGNKLRLTHGIARNLCERRARAYTFCSYSASGMARAWRGHGAGMSRAPVAVVLGMSHV